MSGGNSDSNPDLCSSNEQLNAVDNSSNNSPKGLSDSSETIRLDENNEPKLLTGTHLLTHLLIDLITYLYFLRRV